MNHKLIKQIMSRMQSGELTSAGPIRLGEPWPWLGLKVHWPSITSLSHTIVELIAWSIFLKSRKKIHSRIRDSRDGISKIEVTTMVYTSTLPEQVMRGHFLCNQAGDCHWWVI
jgi:hypothetical protein